MPFQSDKQRRFMFSQHPDIAKRWVSESKRSHKPVTKHSKRKPKRHVARGRKRG